MVRHWRARPGRHDRPANPGAASAPAPRPSFTRRTVVATLTAATLVGFVATVALLARRAPRHTLADIQNRMIPALEALDEAHADLHRAQASFLAVVRAPVDERTGHLAESQDAGAAARRHWEAYLGLARASARERRLQQEYERLRADALAAGAEVFGLLDAPDRSAFDAALEREIDLSDRQLAVLDEIKGRIYRPALVAAIGTLDRQVSAAQRWTWAAVGAALAAVAVGGFALHWVTRREERVIAERERRHELDARRSALEMQLQRGLEMEPTEELTYPVIEAALAMVRPGEPSELLLADSSHAHFRQVLSTDPGGKGPGCPVSAPYLCPAASRGQTQVFPSSARLDACPFLRDRNGHARSAACVPVNIAGTANGVIHTTGPDQQPPDPEQLAELELVARKAGERIGYLRVLARTEMRAHIDGLTGLLNRRSFEDAALGVVEEGRPFVVAFADLDRFKDLNDAHGHEMGDRALRLFGRVLRDSIRPTDVAARWGGEEFVALLPDVALPDARLVAERIREHLRASLAGSTVPEFTVSIGLAAWEPPEDVTDTIARADAAMLHAKRSGRDRVVLATDIPPEALREASAQPAATPTVGPVTTDPDTAT